MKLRKDNKKNDKKLSNDRVDLVFEISKGEDNKRNLNQDS